VTASMLSCDTATPDAIAPPTESAAEAIHTRPVADRTHDVGYTPPPADELPLNVLFVLIDDIGVEKLGIYGVGTDVPLTPNLDALADDGVLFENAYTADRCSPTRANILTGRYPAKHGLGRSVCEDCEVGLPDDELTIAEYLATEAPAYRKAVIGKWHLMPNGHPGWRTAPIDQGFDWYAINQLTMASHAAYLLPINQDYWHWEKFEPGLTSVVEAYNLSDNVDDALDFIHLDDDPWFVYLALNTAHAPYHAPPSHLVDPDTLADADDQTGRYDAMIEAADTEIGRLLEGLDPEVRERTVVIVMGDNGTPGDVVTPPLTPDIAKKSPYEGGLHVPLVVAGPTVQQPGTRSVALVNDVDIFATVAELAGAPILPRNRALLDLDGRSFADCIADSTADCGREYVYAENFLPTGRNRVRSEHWKVLRDHRHKLIWKLDADGGFYEFYDLDGLDFEGPNLAESPELMDADDEAAFVRMRAHLGTP